MPQLSEYLTTETIHTYNNGHFFYNSTYEKSP